MRRFQIIVLAGLTGGCGLIADATRTPERPSISFNREAGEVVIYGNLDQENRAIVLTGIGDGSDLISPTEANCQGLFADPEGFRASLSSPNAPTTVANRRVLVALRSGGVNSGDCLIESYPLFSGISIAFDEAPASAQRLVREVFFFGGAADDVFENTTDIPSLARGNDGNDTLTGGRAHDELDGGEGDDRLFGGDGPDILQSGFGTDTLFGGPGADTLATLSTGNDNDVKTLCGGNGDDLLEGASLAAENRLEGSSGADTLIGYNDAGTITVYEFNSQFDVIIENGDVLTPGTFGFPTSGFVDCG